LAFPFISPLMVLLAIPFALKRQMSGSVSLMSGVAMVIGFGYWVLSAFCVSLGHSGAIPPWLSAWVPNGIFALIGLFFFTAEEGGGSKPVQSLFQAQFATQDSVRALKAKSGFCNNKRLC